MTIDSVVVDLRWFSLQLHSTAQRAEQSFKYKYWYEYEYQVCTVQKYYTINIFILYTRQVSRRHIAHCTMQCECAAVARRRQAKATKNDETKMSTMGGGR